MSYFPETRINDPAMGNVGTKAHVSHFGALKTSTAIPVVKGNFAGSALDTTIWKEESSNGGAVSVAQGVGSLTPSTNAAGSVKLISVKKGVFEAGQVTTYQSGVYAGAPVANNIRRWGLMDASEQNGLFFELNGTDFNVVARAGGTDTRVESASFNGDSDFTPSATNNTYRIFYSAGRAIFCRASGGNIVALHTMVDGAYPLVEDLDLALYYENTNTGNTTSVEMRVRGASTSVLGDLRRFNQGGAQIVGDFGTAAALGDVSGYKVQTKFGRNPDIDTGTTPEDMWNGGSTYTGFNATANENLEVFSADANDQGSLVSSGTATGGSATTLIDTGATFSADGVAVGDLVINDTQAAHGVITSVDSETQVTVFRMNGVRRQGIVNSTADSYRIANANDTGAAVVLIDKILNNSFVEQDPKYVIMNGTTGVSVTVDAMRTSRGRVVLSGSSQRNEGVITVRQATTTANVFAQIPTFGRTTIAMDTVPAGKIFLIKRVRVSITRTNGSAGSATITLNVREKGGSWQAIRVFELNTASATDFVQIGGSALTEGTDIKFTVDDVSDNNTVAEAAIEYFVIDA